jgi:hypothetical protein
LGRQPILRAADQAGGRRVRSGEQLGRTNGGRVNEPRRPASHPHGGCRPAAVCAIVDGEMTPDDPAFATLISASSALAAMVWLAVKHHGLELRVRSRRCAACGRLRGGDYRCDCRS